MVKKSSKKKIWGGGGDETMYGSGNINISCIMLIVIIMVSCVIVYNVTEGKILEYLNLDTFLKNGQSEQSD